MAGERSLYRKIHVVLDYAREEKHRDQESLADYIYSRSPNNFIYYWLDKSTKVVKHKYSRKSISSVIRFCIELELLSKENFMLTDYGNNAIDPRRFPQIVGNNLVNLMEQKGIPLDYIHKAIIKIIQDSRPKPPTADEIWEYLEDKGEDVSFNTFKQWVTILGQCRKLSMTQKRIYFPF